MFSIMSRLIFLLFTLLHIKSVCSSLSHYNGGYIYQTPPGGKSFEIITPTAAAYTTHHGLESFPSPVIPKHLPSYGINFNFGLPSIINNDLTDVFDDSSYYADGRILKQYEVMEHIPGDQLPDEILNKAPLLLASLLSKYSKLSPSLLTSMSLPKTIQFPSQRQPFVAQPVTRNHGPVALGSGALGYIRLPNGGVYLGSGSLGYISGADRIREINDARMTRIIQPSPLVFGTTHLNRK